MPGCRRAIPRRRGDRTQRSHPGGSRTRDLWASKGDSPMSPTSRSRVWTPIALLAILGLVASVAAADDAPTVVSRALTFRGLVLSPDASGVWTELHLPDALPRVALGEPAVPSRRMAIPLPAGSGVADLRVSVLEEEWLHLPRPVAPYAGERSLDGPPLAPSAPRESVYAQSAPFPGAEARLIAVTERSSGTRYAIVEIHPLQYEPASGRLRWIREARLWIEVESEAPLQGRLECLRPDLRAMRAGPGTAPGGRLLLLEQGLAPTETPSVEGSPVLYVIISPPDPEMVDAWQTLADWKTAHGYPALVVTTDWINEQYPTGVDLPQRMRLFLRDAHMHWGLRWALIGADPRLVPTRYAHSWHLDREEGGRDIACDYYFACLGGTWDADRDGIFGESEMGIAEEETGLYASDDVDFLPELHVGRVSAESAADVELWLEKYFAYVQTPASTGYLDRDLLLGEVLWDVGWTRFSRQGGIADCPAESCYTAETDPPCRRDGDGQSICARTDGASYCFRVEEAIQETDCPHDLVFLLERPEYWATHEPFHSADLLSREPVIDYLNDGYHLVHHVGHADRDRWAVGGSRRDEDRLLVSDLVRLTNGDQGHYYLVYGVNCSSAAIEYPSLAEKMLLLDGGGCVSYIGATNADFPSTADSFARDYYHYLFDEPGGTVGDGLFLSMAANALTGEQIHQEGSQRFLLFTRILLGEPGMPVWWQTPAAPVVSYAAELPLGTDTITVSVGDGGAPVQDARVCVHKEGEVYAVALTGADGLANLPFAPRTAGAFQISVSSAHLRPFTGSGQVVDAASGAVLVAEQIAIVDDGSAGSAGNGNGRIEAGETVRLVLTASNQGPETASFVQARLGLGDEAPASIAVISDSIATIGELAADSSGSDSEAFLLEIAADPAAIYLDDATLYRVPFELAMQTGKSDFTTSFVLEVTRPDLRLSPNVREDLEGGNLHLWLGLRNDGYGSASDLLATLQAQTQVQVVGDDQLGLRDIAPGDTVLAGPFELDPMNEALARLTLTVESSTGGEAVTLHERTIDLRAPMLPGNLFPTGLPEAVSLTWDESIDPNDGAIGGYLVYRALSGTGAFELVTETPLEDHRYLLDAQLGDLTQYDYWVQPIDAAGNLGESSDTMSVYTAPPMLGGWPNRFREALKSSPLVCELDGVWSTKREVLLGGERLYAFHGDGTQVSDGDNVGSSYGPFCNDGRNFWGKPACADIDGDGSNELLAVAWETKELLCYPAGGGSAKWRVGLTGPYPWFSPVLADIDGNDGGLLEVVLCHGRSSRSGIYVYNHDGSPMTGDGELINVSGTDLYHPPAVGDVDGDGQMEIVHATRTSSSEKGSIWVVKGDGSQLPGFEGGLNFGDLGLAQHTTASPVLYDYDQDGRDEIFAITPARLWCIGEDGSLIWFQPIQPSYSISSRELLPEPAMGDIDGDGLVEIALVDDNQRLWAYHAATGDTLDGFPIEIDGAPGAIYGSCILANADSDSLPEILFGGNDNFIRAYKHDGTVPRGFPIYFGGSLLKQSLAAWDVDIDGYQNLIVQSEEMLDIAVYDLPHAPFDTLVTARTNPWPMRYRDDRNTGRFTSDPPVGIQLTMQQPEIDPQGVVTLRWISGELLREFHVLRMTRGIGRWESLGEVPGASEPGTHTYSFRDRPPAPGSFVYRVDPIALGGGERPGPTVEVSLTIDSARSLALQRVMPDPLTAGRVASITFSVPGSTGSRVPTRLHVVDVEGRRVRTLVDDTRAAGVHTTYWDGRDGAGRLLPSGFYVLHLESRGREASGRLLLLR
ncbi:MAG: hypothetical protein GF330_05405 [Candidatus Eisenbacteria bacterium]|nr:hypothetical protein [Candidatus Eisenbacteria bacterium]